MKRIEAMVLLVVLFCGAQGALADDVAIQISPNTVVLDSDGVWLTVHADIALSDVQNDSVALEEIPAAVVKADAQGNLVAKFSLAEVKMFVSPPNATLTLTGLNKAGDLFSGSDSIRVK